MFAISETFKEEHEHETCKDIKYTDTEQQLKEEWLWRVPDIMSVSM